MGLIWDMIQHTQINEQKERSSSLEGRIEDLETELRKTQELLMEMVSRLEARFGEDFDGDGRVG